ncbi:hypothetical protein ACFLW0_06295 [Chloroflexota bacterium]
MAEDNKNDILIMAILMVTVDDVLSCAYEVGLPQEQITEETLEKVKEATTKGISNWRSTIRRIVKEVITGEYADCPMGMTCSPACSFHQSGECELAKELNKQ